MRLWIMSEEEPKEEQKTKKQKDVYAPGEMDKELEEQLIILE